MVSSEQKIPTKPQSIEMILPIAGIPAGYLQDKRPERSLAWSPFAVVQVRSKKGQLKGGSYQGHRRNQRISEGFR